MTLRKMWAILVYMIDIVLTSGAGTFSIERECLKEWHPLFNNDIISDDEYWIHRYSGTQL